MNNAAVNMMYVFICMFFILLDIYVEIELLGHMLISYFSVTFEIETYEFSYQWRGKQYDKKKK